MDRHAWRRTEPIRSRNGEVPYLHGNHGLSNNVVLGILPDDHGNLWISTNHGMSRFTPATGSFRNFDVDDGLQSNEFDHGAYCRLVDGTMLFGGISGLNIFHPDSIRNNSFVPPVVLTGFSVFDRPVELPLPVYMTDRITLSHTDNFFSFSFVALNYSSSKKNQYMYRLDGAGSRLGQRPARAASPTTPMCRPVRTCSM